jgi:hypothetical protein
MLWLCQFLKDVFGEMIFDFTMAGNRLTRAGVWILVPIMPAAMTNEYASELLDLSNQGAPLHAI